MADEGWGAYLKQQFGLWNADRKEKQAEIVKNLTPKFPPPPIKSPKGYRIVKNDDKYIAQFNSRHYGWQSLAVKDLYEWTAKSEYYKYCYCKTIEQAREVIKKHVTLHTIKVIEVVE